MAIVERTLIDLTVAEPMVAPDAVVEDRLSGGVIEHIHPLIGDEEVAAVERVLRSGRLAQGPEVDAFEQEFASVVGTAHAIAVANGTVSIEIGLQALGIGPGDEVVVPSLTFVATANAVRRVGAIPVFADIDTKTYCLTAATIAPHLSERTRAVMPVHLYGHPADMGEIGAMCDDKGLHLIEDAAQAIGAAWRGRSVGSFGVFASFSLYATKNVTTGEGGMLTTNDDRIASVARGLRSHESSMVANRLQVASNARMSEIEAAIGRVQLSRLDRFQERRRQLAAVYDNQLSSSLITPHVAPEATHAYHQYTIRSSHRADLIESLEAAGVGYGLYYPIPVHLREGFWDSQNALPDTEAVASEVISLPIRADLTDDEQARVIGAANSGAGR